ncbi:unnamed protein product [Penicillium olsonii]|uniref:Uncharacterized protein n=1 Tax=Penicillium olsonii TaxID=99116 RepID=A0A9W4MZ10_PENOL|nr:unnamed protein product [Penicillium olsonii]CAG8178911.1 unnamed protein product [Penicillium olsonii]
MSDNLQHLRRHRQSILLAIRRQSLSLHICQHASQLDIYFPLRIYGHRHHLRLQHCRPRWTVWHQRRLPLGSRPGLDHHSRGIDHTAVDPG